MLRSCPRCGRIHEPGRCSRPRERGRRTREQAFRSTGAWQALAEAVRERDLNTCIACRHASPPSIVTQGLEVHHIVPLRADWSLRLVEENCATLCVPCHKLAEAGEITAEQLREWIADDARLRPAGRVSLS